MNDVRKEERDHYTGYGYQKLQKAAEGDVEYPLLFLLEGNLPCIVQGTKAGLLMITCLQARVQPLQIACFAHL